MSYRFTPCSTGPYLRRLACEFDRWKMCDILDLHEIHIRGVKLVIYDCSMNKTAIYSNNFQLWRNWLNNKNYNNLQKFVYFRLFLETKRCLLGMSFILSLKIFIYFSFKWRKPNLSRCFCSKTRNFCILFKIMWKMKKVQFFINNWKLCVKI